MKSSGGAVYEVRCPVCNVSFAPETRRCLHCGGRTSLGGTPPPTEPVFSLDPDGTVVPNKARGPEWEWPTSRDSGDVVEEEASARPGWLRLGGGLVWILLALLASLGQMCEGR